MTGTVQPVAPVVLAGTGGHLANTALEGLTMTAKDLTDQVAVTYKMLRLGLALLAFAFPILLWGGGNLFGLTARRIDECVLSRQ